MSLIQKQGQQKEDVYLNFVNSIKSDVTKKIYAYNLRLFMEFCDIDKFEDLIGRQNQIITYLMSLREKKLSYNGSRSDGRYERIQQCQGQAQVVLPSLEQIVL
jgi:hypothetical protein